MPGLGAWVPPAAALRAALTHEEVKKERKKERTCIVSVYAFARKKNRYDLVHIDELLHVKIAFKIYLTRLLIISFFSFFRPFSIDKKHIAINKYRPSCSHRRFSFDYSHFNLVRGIEKKNLTSAMNEEMWCSNYSSCHLRERAPPESNTAIKISSKYSPEPISDSV